jgi:hypothetical protein
VCVCEREGTLTVYGLIVKRRLFADRLSLSHTLTPTLTLTLTLTPTLTSNQDQLGAVGSTIDVVRYEDPGKLGQDEPASV